MNPWMQSNLWFVMSMALLLSLNGCQPVPPPATSPTPFAGSPTSMIASPSLPTRTWTVVAYPYPYPYPHVLETRLPSENKDIYPPPSETPVFRFHPTPIPSPTELPLNVVFVEWIPCISIGDYAQCADSTLGLEFEYPTQWGNIEATLRRGQTGLEYLYRFANPAPEFTGYIGAGGISRDFTQGRGGTYTDFAGFGGQSGCDYYDWGKVCEEISQAVVLVLFFPIANHICDPGPTVMYSPLALIAVDLPENPTVQGFVFTAPFLSAEQESALHALLGIGDSLKCDQESKQQFDARVAELVDGARNGTLDSETLENLAQIEHLARSIQDK